MVPLFSVTKCRINVYHENRHSAVVSRALKITQYGCMFNKENKIEVIRKACETVAPLHTVGLHSNRMEIQQMI